MQPPSSEAVRRRLRSIAENRCVIILNEGPSAENTFYVGMNAYEDGFLLACRCAPHLKTHSRILRIRSAEETHRTARRNDGFRDGVMTCAPQTTWVGTITANLESRTAAAEIARELTANYQNQVDCVYADTGILPQVCLALLKARRPEVICIGYENPKQNAEYFQSGMLAGVVEQDIRQQGRACMEAARAFAVEGRRPSAEQWVRSKFYDGGGTMKKKVRVGVFGAGRGRTMVEMLAQYDDAELVAICDKYEPLLENCRGIIEKTGSQVALYTDFEEFFQHEMDAVVLANYANEHAPYAIRLLQSGRHVASEVLPTKNLAEAVALVEAVEASGKVYAYLENYCYFPATMEMRRLYRQGKLGELTHGEGEYVHNCEPIWPDITYGEPEHWRNNMFSTFYCTHSLGPIVHITGLRPERVIGIENNPAGRMLNLGSKSAEAAMEIVQMENGAMVKSIHGNLVREPSAIWYSVYGDKGMAESNRWEKRVDTVNLYEAVTDQHTAYEPKPATDIELASKISGHGGSDFYTIHYFVQKILGNPEGEESIGVYEALDMSLPGLFAMRSILQGNIPLKVPNFRNPEEREPYRADTASSFDGGADRLPVCGKEGYAVPDGTYDRVRKLWLEKQQQSKREP